jgi:hypothetical protein
MAGGEASRDSCGEVNTTMQDWREELARVMAQRMQAAGRRASAWFAPSTLWSAPITAHCMFVKRFSWGVGWEMHDTFYRMRKLLSIGDLSHCLTCQSVLWMRFESLGMA